MSFVEIENIGKRMFERLPIIKRSAKRVYQLLSVALSGEKIKSEGAIERVTPDDAFEYFYGYYDKSPWDATGRYMITIRVQQAYKSVAPKERGVVCLIDMNSGMTIIEVGKAHSWNVQQGCMAQWMGPDFKSRVIYNDFRDGRYCSVIFNIATMQEEKQLPLPVYDVSRDGAIALSLDFNRLHRMRPGYGYSNLPDETKGVLCPDQCCIWKMDIPSGEVTELIKYTDMAAFEPDESMNGAEHKVNHLMISPNGKRFIVLHRWFQKGRKYTRLVTVNIDKTEMYNLSDEVFVSHCYWKNDDEILAFLRKKATGDHYYLMKDKTREYTLLWPELNTDGHCSYSPDKKYIITDTYPNRKRIASVYLCTEDGGVNGLAKRIVRVFSPFKYDNDCRCDLHPRWSRDGKYVAIDSVHEGRRGLYVIDPFVDIGEQEETKKEKPRVVVLMATYNGEKYLRDQIESLRRQKGVNVEILVRDDVSIDSTTSILDEYKNIGVLNWYTGEHLNVQKGFLDLLRHAPVNDWYAFCDQDDVWDEDKLLIAVTKLKKMPKEKPGIYYCGQRLVDQNLMYISNHMIANNRNGYTNYFISNVAGCTTVINRKLLEEVIKYDPAFMLMHDSWIYKVCLALGGNYYADAEPHISYRQHGENVTGTGRGVKGVINQFKKYINKFEIQKQLVNIYDGYSDQMTKEYKCFTEEVCLYNKSFGNWMKLLFTKKLDFKNPMLNVVIRLKILFRKV